MSSRSGLLEKQLVLLTTEVFLQPQEPKTSKPHGLEPLTLLLASNAFVGSQLYSVTLRILVCKMESLRPLTPPSIGPSSEQLVWVLCTLQYEGALASLGTSPRVGSTCLHFS